MKAQFQDEKEDYIKIRKPLLKENNSKQESFVKKQTHIVNSFIWIFMIF